jgi:predicted Zn-dependent protease
LIAAYEECQDEASFLRASEVVERELAGGETAPLLLDHGYLQEVRGRVAVRDALRSYERALELDPAFGRAHRQRIQALVALGQAHDAVRLYERRLSDEPHSVGAHRCLAQACVAAGAFE